MIMTLNGNDLILWDVAYDDLVDEDGDLNEDSLFLFIV